MSTFSKSLLSTDPPILGLDPSIIIPSRRLHFTLGVMALGQTTSTSNPTSHEPLMLEAAIAFLHNLKPDIDEILEKSFRQSEDEEEKKLRVALNLMDAMKLEKNQMAHVVWIGPQDGSSEIISDRQTKRLREIAGEFQPVDIVLSYSLAHQRFYP